MVSYMSLEEQVEADLSCARRRALLWRMWSRLRRDNASDGLLLCFDDLKMISGVSAQVSRGMRTVPVAQIGGSVGRCSEFDGEFLPASASIKERWQCLDRAFFYWGEELPPVRLYKVGGFYFVLEDRHRISVTRYHGLEWIDAYVTEFNSGLWNDLRDRYRRIPDDPDFRAGQRHTQ